MLKGLNLVPFVPDYLIRLKNGKTLVLEVKGQDSEQNRAKRSAMETWVKAINDQGGFGQWCFDVVFDPSQTMDVILSHLDNGFESTDTSLTPHYIGDKAIYFSDEVTKLDGIIPLVGLKITTTVDYAENYESLSSFLTTKEWKRRGITNIQVLDSFIEVLSLCESRFPLKMHRTADGIEVPTGYLWSIDGAEYGSTILKFILNIVALHPSGREYVMSYPDIQKGINNIISDLTTTDEDAGEELNVPVKIVEIVNSEGNAINVLDSYLEKK